MSNIASGFDLNATMASVEQAFTALICHIGFDAALHGLFMAVIIGIIGLWMFASKKKFGKPLLWVCAKLTIFCGVLMVPGLISLAMSGKLPTTGNLSVTSLGFIVFWSLICLHLSAEEMNFEWF